MIKKLSIIKDEEEEKEKPGWLQRMRGIGKLPEYEPTKIIEPKIEGKLGLGAKLEGEISFEAPKIKKLSMIKTEEDVFKPKTLLEATGFKLPTKPEDLKMGIEVALGTWEEQKRANPELQKTENLAREVLSTRGINSSHEHAQIAYIYELLTATETKAGIPMEETIRDIQSNLEKYGSISPPRDWKKAFKEEGILKTVLIGPSDKYGKAESIRRGFIDILIRKESPGIDLISSMGWKGMVLFIGSQAVAGLMEVTPEIWRKLSVKVVDKKISFKEGLNAVFKVGHGEGTAYQRKIFDTAIKQADIKNISVVNMLKKGISFTEAKPRFAFGTKLYAGLPADEIVKSLVKAGRITADIARELSLAKPELVSQVIQNLSIASPAIASKLTPELVKLIPEVKLSKLLGPEQLEATMKGTKPVYLTGTESPDYEKEIKIAKDAGLKIKIGDEKPYAWDLEGNVRATTKDVVIYKPENEKRAIEVLEVLKTPIKEMGKEYHRKLGKLLGYSEEEIRKFIEPEVKEEIPKREVAKPLPKELKDDYLKIIGREVELTTDHLELVEDIRHDIPISKRLQTSYPDLMEKIPEAKFAEIGEKPIVPDTLEKQSIFLYDKPFKELNKSELNKVLETSKQPLPDPTGQYVNKLGTPAKGLQLRPLDDAHARFIFGGFEKGLLTDSHLLVLDKGVSKKILTDIIEKYKKARVKIVQTADISFREAQKIVDKEVEKYKKEFAKDFPKTEDIVTKEAIEKAISLWVLGHQKSSEYMPTITYLTDGKIEIGIDTDKLAFLNKHFPNAEIKATGQDKPVLFLEKGNLKAVVMPIRVEEGEYPFKITGEPKPITELPPGEAIPTIKKLGRIRPTITAKPKTYDLKADLTPEQRIEGNKLIGRIQGLVHSKGLTKKEFIVIKQKYGLSPHLATPTHRMTMPQLQAVLKAVERVRPKRIGYQKVITKKTEGKIESLKDSLIEKYQMTKEAYQETLKDLGIRKEPRYIDAKHFITEEQGKSIIYRLIDESEILKITEPLRIALEENPEIKKLADVIDRRVKSEGERTLKDPSDLNSARSYFQILETISGAPFFTLYQDLINTHLENRADLNHLIEGFDKYRDIIKEERELKKVEDYILAKSDLRGKPESPVNITPKEVELAKKIEGILKGYQSRARTEKFLDNLEHPEDMPQYLEYKKEIDKAKDIYESKGYDELVKYMETQKWGVRKSGYDPIQVVSARIRTAYKSKGLSMIFGKSHIKIRKDIEYKEQDTNIITRVIAYKRQMDNLSLMAPKVRALITLANKNLDKFKNPDRVRSNLQVFFRELKGYDRRKGWFERGINRIYAQAMITIIMGSPPLAFRNLGQNFGLGHDKAMLVDPRNKKLTPDEIVYLDTYVQQAIFMQTDWFLTGEKPLGFRIGKLQIGLERLTNLIKRINLYPKSDIANRHWGFWGKINQVRMAFEDKTISLKKKTEKAKFSDFSLLEQKRALQILAKDGQEAMNEYVAKVYVDDVHFLYERSQRSLAEMGPYGIVFGNLMLFPRSYWEKLVKMSKKMTGKFVPFNERARAFKVIASILIGGALVGVAYTKTTGRRKPPYDPLLLLAYQTGGLMIGTVEALNDVYVETIQAVRGDRRALAGLTSSVPALADHLIPFYNYMLRGYEAFLGDPLVNKNIDVYALKKLRQLVDNEYKIRGGVHSVERNAIEKWQYFLSGAGVDVAIAERKKKEREAVPIIIGEPKIPRLEIPTISKPGIKKLSPIEKF